MAPYFCLSFCFSIFKFKFKFKYIASPHVWSVASFKQQQQRLHILKLTKQEAFKSAFVATFEASGTSPSDDPGDDASADDGASTTTAAASSGGSSSTTTTTQGCGGVLTDALAFASSATQSALAFACGGRVVRRRGRGARRRGGAVRLLRRG